MYYFIKKDYVPDNLSYKIQKKLTKDIIKSKKLYQRGKYYDRQYIKSYKSKPSKHIVKLNKKYKINIDDINKLSKTFGCSKNALMKIIKKGQGAYYSSGSRPNQTSQSWGKARLASALTTGKAAAVDYNILINGCKKGSLGYKSAVNARKKYGYGNKKTRKNKIIIR